MKKKVAWGLACCLLLGLIGCQKEQGSSEQSQIGSVGECVGGILQFQSHGISRCQRGYHANDLRLSR
ncbi:MAG: hypothetical protein ACLR23_18145 [Clostridia bacterium]